MKKLVVLVAAFALLAGAACSKDSAAQRPRTVARGETYQAPPDQSVWNDAWDTISAGASEVGDEIGDAGQWTWEKTKDGAVVVGRKTQQVAGKTGQETTDASVLGMVKSRLIDADGVDAEDVDVDVDEGTVVLRGRVSSRREAGEAIRVALDTRGVDRVRSYLTWPDRVGRDVGLTF